MRITYGCCSDRGDVRTENQDRVLALSGEVEGKKRGFSCWRTVWAVWSMVRRSVHILRMNF